MMRSTHSIRVRLCMPTRVSSRISTGRPMIRANRRPPRSTGVLRLQHARVALQGRRVVVDQRVVQHLGRHPTRLVGVVDAFAVERVHAARGVADHQVRRARLGTDRPTHRDATARGGALRSVGIDLPPVGHMWAYSLRKMGGVDAPEVTERRQQADADVHRAVADREDPAVPGHRVAVAVLHVERALDPRFGVPGGFPVRPDRGAVGPLLRAERAQRPPKRLLAPSATTTYVARISIGSSWPFACTTAPRTKPARRRVTGPRSPAGGWRRRPRRSSPPSRRGRGGARHSVLRVDRCVGHSSSSALPIAVQRRPSYRWNRDRSSARPISPNWYTARGVSPSPHVFSRG